MAGLTRILVLGVDAADARLIAEWSEAGELPTWRSLRSAGRVTDIANATGIYTGAIWPSFFTGTGPGAHGRYFYRQIVPGSYDIAPFKAEDLKREPLWDALGRAGRRVAVVDVPKAPWTRSPNVTQVADWGTHDPDYDGVRCWPGSIATDLVARYGTEPVGDSDNYDYDLAAMRVLRDRLLARVAKKEAMLAELLGQGGWDLFLGTFSESHCAGHRFWHLHDPTHPRHDPEEAKALGDPLLEIYRAIDGALGRLIALAGGDCHVVVYASHGMAPHYDGTFLLDEVLRRLEGKAPASGQRALRALVPLWRCLPRRWRVAARGMADAADEATMSSDRRGRDCFLIPTNDNCAGIRVNLRGREPDGRIAAGAEYDAFCEALAADLAELVNLQTGAPAVRAVHRTDRLFPGEHAGDLPDLLVQWHRETPFAGLASPKVGEVRGTWRGSRTGDHRPYGLLIACGPGLEPGGAPDTASVTDIAPTLACALGVPLENATGTPIPALASALAAHPVGA